MFKDYEIIKYLGYDASTDQFEYLTKIIDDDFENELSARARLDAAASAAAARALIKIYSQKQLDVARNLMLLILKINEKYHWLKLNYIIEDLDKYIPEFKPYSNQIKQLLLFS